MRLKANISIDDLIKGIAAELDYDISKQLDEETAEEPEFVEEMMNSLRITAMRFFDKE